MSCCGEKRRFAGNPGGPGPEGGGRGTADRSNPGAGATPIRYAHSYFQYIGRTGLTVRGPVSGVRYRFEVPGAVVGVDPRDRRSLAALPMLREVHRPW